MNSLLHDDVRLASIDAVHVDHLCNSSWSIAVAATINNPTYNDIRIDDVQATVTATVALDIALPNGADGAAGLCTGWLSALVNRTMAASVTAATVLPSNNAVHLAVSQPVSTVGVNDATLLRQGRTSVSLNIAVVPDITRAQHILSALSDLTDLMQQMEDSWTQWGECANQIATATLTVSAEADISAVAHFTILSSSYSQSVSDTVSVTILTHRTVLPLGSAATAPSGTPYDTSSTSIGSTFTAQWTNISAQLRNEQVSAGTTVVMAASAALSSLPLYGPMTVSLSPSLLWDVQFGNDPLVTLLIQPGTLTANASNNTSSTLAISLNATLAGSITRGNVGAWHSMLQAILNTQSWPSLSSISFSPTTASSTANCTAASLVDSRYIRSSAIQYLLNTPSSANTSSAADQGGSSQSALSLSGARLIALSVDGSADDSDTLAAALTVDFGQSSFGRSRVMVDGELPGLSLLLNTSTTASSPAAALSLQPLSLVAGGYRVTFQLSATVLNESVVSEQLLPAAVNGIDSSSTPLALGLTARAADAGTSIVSSILDGLTLVQTVDSFDGFCRSWSAALSVSDFVVDVTDTSAQQLALTADVAYDWVNVIQLPALTVSFDIDAFASAGTSGEEKMGSLSLQLSTLLGWPSQTLQVHADLTLPSANCSSASWMLWETAASSPLASSPCWQSYYVGRFVSDAPFTHPLTLRVTIGGFSVTFPYRSFAAAGGDFSPPVLLPPDAALFGCAGSEVGAGGVVGVVSSRTPYSSQLNGTVQWWMPVALAVSGVGLLGSLPITGPSAPTLLVHDVVQVAALSTPASLSAFDARWQQLEPLSSVAADTSLSLVTGEAINGSFCVPVYDYSYVFSVVVADVFILPITANSTP